MDHFIISARPQPYDIIPYVVSVYESDSSKNTKTIYVKGRSFFNITNVYFAKIINPLINTDVFNVNLTSFNPFSAVPKLATQNPQFYGYEINDYTIIDDKHLLIKIPEILSKDGYFDIVIQNEAGLGFLTKDSVVPFLPVFEGQQDIQKPCTVGVQVQIIS